jgi:hypothetical protein
MSGPAKDQAVLEEQVSEHDQIAAQMKNHHEYLTRQLRRMRIFVRILDLGFGYVFPWNIAAAKLEFLQSR